MRRAFTLLELMAVVIVLAAMVGLVAPVLVRTSSQEAERRQVVELVSWLSLERVEAMRRSAVIEIELRLLEDSTLAAVGPDAERSWSGWRTILVTSGGAGGSGGSELEPVDDVRLLFDALGRTATRTIWLRSLEESDRIWRVEFDPISGRPSLRSGLQPEAS